MFAINIIVSLVCLCVSVKGVIIRDYNLVNFNEYDTFEEFAEVYMNLQENVVNQNIFLGSAEEHCKHHLESPAFRGAQRHGGGGVVAAASLPTNELRKHLEQFNDAPVLNKCAQIFYYRIGDKINKPTGKTTNFEHSALNRWSADLMRVRGLKFTNNFPFPVTMYWHEESTDPVASGRLEPGQSLETSTFLGHVFSANADQPVEGLYENTEDESEEESSPAFRHIVDFTAVNGLDYTFSPFNRIQTCEILPGTQTFYAANNKVMSCDDMKVRLIEFTHQVWHEKRLGLNFVQPQLVPPVTHNGFEHRKLPEATYKWLKAWYDREQMLNEINEGGVGPCMNQHIAPTAVTHLTPANKDRLSREMKSILEEWYGGELRLTSIYGIRKYINGSVLRMHVDTVNTHVVSAIINVDQEVEQEWPLLILDHDDNEHRIIMRPGDMVLYESAKLLHGRPDVFVGSHYDNIFIHYQPTSGWDYSWL